MPVHGKVVVIRRNGSDGSHFPITNNTCVFGRSQDCDIRVQLPYVSNEQCEISLTKSGHCVLKNFSKSNKTAINGEPVSDISKLANKDIITIVDRSFRFEYPENSPFFKTKSRNSTNEIMKSPLDAKQSMQTDSPFGKLVKDMKTMIKSGTPLRQRNIGREEKTTKKTSSKATEGAEKLHKKSSVPPAHEDEKLNKDRKSVSKATTELKSKKKASETSNSSGLSMDMLNLALIEKYASSDSTESFEKENIEEQRKSKRLSGKRSSISKKSVEPDTISSPTLESPKQGLSATDSSLAKQALDLDRSSSSVKTSKKRRRSEPLVRKTKEKQVIGKKKKSQKRVSLPSQTSKVSVGSKSQEVSSNKAEKSDENRSYEPESIGGSLNSSESVEILNVGMITESLTSIDSTVNMSQSDLSSGDYNRSVTRSTRSSLGSPKASASLGVLPESQLKDNKSPLVQSRGSTRSSLGSPKSEVLAIDQSEMTRKSTPQVKKLTGLKSPRTPVAIVSSPEIQQKDTVSFDVKQGRRSTRSSFESPKAAVSLAEKTKTPPKNASPSTPQVTKLATLKSPKTPVGVVSTPEPHQIDTMCADADLRRRSMRSSLESPKTAVSLVDKPARTPRSASPTASHVKKSKSPKTAASTFNTPESQQKEVTPSSAKSRRSTPKAISSIAKTAESSNQNATPVAKDNVPNISLTLSDLTPLQSEDPYSFPDTDSDSNKKAKKYKRRSSGSTGLSRKQTLLLFGSPRVKEVTPLRRSIGRLRKNSEPLMEAMNEAASPKQSPKPKKTFQPLPQTEEIENNSSPIKKPSAALRSAPSKRAIPLSKKLHRVSFGPNLSPEQFLKTFPPNTPVKKGATPSKPKRKSVAAAGTTSLPLVAEQHEEKTFKSPGAKGSPSSPQSYKKVDRTPTPFKPDLKKLKGKPLLQQVLHAAIANNKRLEQDSTSPKLAKKRKSEEKVEQISKKVKKNIAESGSPKKVKGSPRVGRNTPIVNVHRTARNLHRRSIRSATKPLWSEIVKRPSKDQAVQKVASKIAAIKVAKLKKTVKSGSKVASRKDHHVDSPATIYISRTKSRIRPTKTPKPSKSAAPAILDLPANEDFTGMSDLFATPSASEPLQDEEPCLDIITPKSVGEMLVSPMSHEDQSRYDLTLTDDSMVESGASPEFKKTRRSKGTKKSAEVAKSPKVLEGGLKQKKTPKDKTAGCPTVKEHFGTKRLLKTPREPKSKAVEEHLGTKRIFKTPRGDKNQEVIEHFGTRRLLRTPRDAKSQPVEENFGTKRIFKTPRGEKNPAVEENFGTKRLLRSPKEAKGKAVEEHFGTKRLFKSPKEPKSAEVAENFGTKRIFKSPRGAKSAPVEKRFGLGQLFHEKTGRRKTAEIPESDDLHLDQLFASEANHEELIPPVEASATASEATPSRTTRTASRNTKKANVKPVAEKVVTLQKRGRAKKSPEKNEDATDNSNENSSVAEQNTPKQRHAKKTAAKIPAVEEVESAVKATRSKKQVTFHASVKSSLIEDSPKQEESAAATKTGGRSTRKRGVAAVATEDVVQLPTRRGRNRKIVESSELPKDQPNVEVKPAKQRKLSKKEEKITNADELAAGSDATVGDNTSTKPAPRSRVNRRNQEQEEGKVEIAKGSSKSGTRATRTTKAQAKAQNNETKQLGQTEIESKPIRTSGRKAKAQDKVETEEKQTTASDRVIVEAVTSDAPPAGQSSRTKRGTAKNVKTDSAPVAEESAPEVSAVKPGTRAKRGKPTKTAEQDEAVTPAAAEPKRSSRRGGAAAKKDEVVEQDVAVSSVAEPKRSTRGGRAKTTSKNNETVDERAPSQPEAPKQTRGTRKGRQTQSTTLSQISASQDHHQSEDMPVKTTRGRRAKNETEVKTQTVEERTKPTRTSGRKGKAQSIIEVQVTTSAAAAETPKPVRNSGSRDKAQKTAEVEEKVTADMEANVPAKRSARTKTTKVNEKVEVEETPKPVRASGRKGKTKKASEVEEKAAATAAETPKPVRNSGRKGKAQKTAEDEEKVTADIEANVPVKRGSRTKRTKANEKASEDAVVEEAAPVPVKRSARVKKETKIVENVDSQSSQSSDVSTTSARNSRSRPATKKQNEEEVPPLPRTTRKRKVEEPTAVGEEKLSRRPKRTRKNV